MLDLLPCPFCGSAVDLLGEPEFTTMIFCRPRTAGGFYLVCSGEKCYVELGRTGEQEDLDMVFGAYKTEDEAVAAWNAQCTRPGNVSKDFLREQSRKLPEGYSIKIEMEGGSVTEMLYRNNSAANCFPGDTFTEEIKAMVEWAIEDDADRKDRNR